MAFENISNVVNPALQQAADNVAQPYTPAAPTAGADALGQTVPASPTNAAQPYQPTTSFGKILSQSLAGTALDPAARQAAASQPLGWAKTLVGSAMQAASGIQAGIGDAAAVGKVPEGAGALYGIAKTMQAHNQRIAQQKAQMSEDQKNQAIMAESNVRMLHEQKLIHQIDQADQEATDKSVDKSIDAGSKWVDKLKSSPVPSRVDGDGLNSDEIAPYMKSNQLDPTKVTAYATGKKFVGENPDGTPKYRTTYTLVEPGSVTLGDPNDPSKDKEILDRLNKYAPPQGTNADGTPRQWKPGQTFTGVQGNAVYQQAADAEALEAARAKALDEAEIEDTKRGQAVEAARFSKDSNANSAFVNALANNGNDPIKSVQAISAIPSDPNDPKSPPKYPNALNDARAFYGEQEWKELVTQNTKEAGKADDTIAAIAGGNLKGMSTIAEAQAVRSNAQARLTANPNDTDAKKAYQLSDGMIKGDIADKVVTKNKEREADYTPQDIQDIEAGVRSYTFDPEKMRGLPPLVRAKVLAALGRDPQGWSEGAYKARYDTTTDFRPEGKGGQQIQSLNSFAEHARDADVLIPAMSNSSSPFYNMAMNKVKTAVGGEQYGKMTAALEAVKDEYLNFLKNAHATSVEEQARAESILNPNMSPSQIHGVIQQMANIIAARGGQLQRNYTTTMGKPYAGMLDPDNDATLRKWGVNTDKMNGVQTQQKPPVQPPNTTHMQKPDGTFVWLPNDQVPNAVNAGGKVVQ